MADSSTNHTGNAVDSFHHASKCHDITLLNNLIAKHILHRIKQLVPLPKTLKRAKRKEIIKNERERGETTTILEAYLQEFLDSLNIKP